MPWSDFLLVFQWWGTLFLIGAAAYPLTRRLFHGWADSGYLFSKAIGMATVTFLVYVGAMTHLIPFTQGVVWGAMILVFVVGMFLTKREVSKRPMMYLVEEFFFFAALLFWTWIKAHEPSIHNLEKFMDYGFTRSILNSTFFPPADMWYAGSPINYYYFGHTVMAMLTRLSGIDLSYTFNLMLSSLFALTFTMSFSIGRELTKKVWGGILTAFLVTLAGNMQTLYAFTRGYTGDAVKPFWELLWPLKDVAHSLTQGLTTYWYANATRFIPYTIHEFPSYSFVVSDVHGHVLSLPFVLLAIALLIKIWHDKKIPIMVFAFFGLLCGVLLMTNALDGPIYFGLASILLLIKTKKHFRETFKQIGVMLFAVVLASIPFLQHFSSFVHGVALNCPPAFLVNSHIGPIIFEGVEKCQHSPLWMLLLLWGFFVFCGTWVFTKYVKEPLLRIFFLFSLALIIFPEFFYFKDIYPMHFRSNTMFKLGYQAFIMFSIVSGYVIAKLWRKKLFLLLIIPQLFLVSIYPFFSVRSYFNSLRTYQGIYGLGWLRDQYPNNWMAINWLNSQKPKTIVEADGDSYTDADMISAFTGMPTVVGWPVHEWLWRGSYDVVSPRRTEVRELYESDDLNVTRTILRKYNIHYVVVGILERQRFPQLKEKKFTEVGHIGFSRGDTIIYTIDK